MISWDNFFKISSRIGKEIPFWIQGAGGNVSQKNKELNQMIIKASGFRLEEVNSEVGAVLVKLDSLKSTLLSINNESDYETLLIKSKINILDLNRPSMEAGFHAALNGTYVAHFHSVLTFLMFKNQSLVRQLLGELTVHFVEFTNPGLLLSKKLIGVEQEVIILENHGVILNTDRLELIIDWDKYEKLILDYFNIDFGNTDSLIEGPFKIYYPDTAVMATAIQSVIEPTGKDSIYKLKKDAFEIDRNASEIWLATQWIFKNFPDTFEISEEQIKMITQMPTEKFRLKILGKK